MIRRCRPKTDARMSLKASRSGCGWWLVGTLLLLLLLHRVVFAWQCLIEALLVSRVPSCLSLRAERRGLSDERSEFVTGSDRVAM